MANDIEARLAVIEARNARVELEKAWETSLTRRACISVLTYAAAVAWLVLTGDNNAPLHAVVPAAGYLLSNLALGKMRRFWERARSK